MTIRAMLDDLARRNISVTVEPDGYGLRVWGHGEDPWTLAEVDWIADRRALIVAYLTRRAAGTLPRLVVSHPRRPSPRGAAEAGRA